MCMEPYGAVNAYVVRMDIMWHMTAQDYSNKVLKIDVIDD